MTEIINVENKLDLNIENKIKKIQDEMEFKIKDNKFFFHLIQKYISITNEYKKKLFDELVFPIQNNNCFFDSYFSILRQIFEQEISSLENNLQFINKILKDNYYNDDSRIEELINQLYSINFDNEVENLNKKQNEYYNQLSFIENSLKEMYMNKKELNISELISIGKNCEKIYLNSIEKVNEKQANFLNEGNKYINELILINKEIYNSLLILSKSMIGIIEIKLKNQYDNIVNLNQAVKSFSIESFMKLKEKKNLILYSPKKIEFIPYSLKIFDIMKKENNLKKKTLNSNQCINIIGTMKDNFKDIAVSYDIKTEIIKIEIEQDSKDFVDIEKNGIDTQKFNNLLKYFENREYRFLFMTTLNKIRAEGNFQISIRGFQQLGKIIKVILERVKIEKDNEIMRYIIIMCQTYYCLDMKKNKVYLIKYIENDDIYQSKEFWDIYSQEIIDSEIENLKKKINNNNIVDKEKDKSSTISNLVFSKLLSLIHNMLEFRYNKNYIKEFVKLCGGKYHVENEMMEQIVLLIGDEDYKPVEKFDEEKLFKGKIKTNDINIKLRNIPIKDIEEDEENNIYTALLQRY